MDPGRNVGRTRPVPVSESGSIPAARRDLPAPRVTLPSSTSRLEGLSLAGEGRSTAFEPVMEIATAVFTGPNLSGRTLGLASTRPVNPEKLSCIPWKNTTPRHRPSKP